MINRLLQLKIEGNKDAFFEIANQVSTILSGNTPDEILEIKLEEVLSILEIKNIKELYKAEFLENTYQVLRKNIHSKLSISLHIITFKSVESLILISY